MQSKLKILFIDDHAGLRDGMGHLLAEKNPALSFRFADGEADALAVLQNEGDISLVILDLNLDGEDGLHALQTLRAQNPDLLFLVYTMYSDPLHIEGAIKAGVQGYVTKNAGAEELESAICAVAGGRTFFNAAAEKIMQSLALGKDAQNQISDEVPLSFVTYKTLTKAERAVFELTAQKKEINEIAEILGKKEKTVANLRSLVFQKLRLHDRLDVIEFAKQIGVIF